MEGILHNLTTKNNFGRVGDFCKGSDIVSSTFIYYERLVRSFFFKELS